MIGLARGFVQRWFVVALLSSGLPIHAADKAQSRPAPAFEIGVGIHLGLNLAERPLVLDLLSEGAFSSVRDEVLWSRVETSPGRFEIPDSLAQLDQLLLEDAPRLGMRPVVILDYGNRHHGAGLPVNDAQRAAFARYASFVARRYRDSAAYFEIWNEWNEGLGASVRPRPKGSAEDYVALLEQVVPVLRAAAPEARILAGATSRLDRKWSRRFAELGGLALVDGFSVHPYNYEHANPALRAPERVIDGLRSLEAEMRGAAGRQDPIPFYVTEIGMPHSVAPQHLTQAEVTNYLTRFLLLARAQDFIKGVWIYELLDRDLEARGKESRFGLHDRIGRPREAMAWIGGLAELLLRARGVEHRSEGNHHVVRWTSIGDGTMEAHWSTAGAVQIRGAAGIQPLAWPGAAAQGGDAMDATVGSRPRLFRVLPEARS